MVKRLERCIRRVKKSLKKGNPFAICRAALSRLTTRDAGHRHKWIKGMKFTTYSKITGRHKHRINLKRRLALPARKGGHTHRLLKRR